MLFNLKEQLIDVFKSVGQVVGLRYVAHSMYAYKLAAHSVLKTGLRPRNRESKGLRLLRVCRYFSSLYSSRLQMQSAHSQKQTSLPLSPPLMRDRVL